MRRRFRSRAGRRVQLAASRGEEGFELRATGEDLDHRATARVLRTPDGTLLVERGGLVRPARVSTSGETAWLWTPAGSATIEWVQPRRAERSDGGSVVRAPMTGRIVLVEVEVGAEVRRGQQVIVIEAMKMEQPLRAPRDGVVAAVTCEPGALVDGGTALLTLVPPEPA